MYVYTGGASSGVFRYFRQRFLRHTIGGDGAAVAVSFPQFFGHPLERHIAPRHAFLVASGRPSGAFSGNVVSTPHGRQFRRNRERLAEHLTTRVLLVRKASLARAPSHLPRRPS